MEPNNAILVSSSLLHRTVGHSCYPVFENVILQCGICGCHTPYRNLAGWAFIVLASVNPFKPAPPPHQASSSDNASSRWSTTQKLVGVQQLMTYEETHRCSAPY